ncbi:hypothetical protein M2322_002907 [Rhodoblastus acidophilus]|uniref:hypothetical protein n=1 Tax=Rhodoblastus acidophilus TaxID=1074 RepID=UPI002224801E|nr:hypothetical protein [Rhodoblastus acidophilus]MCW2317348.1 hypothetical protein [Rhodoblastus acidophilus]
MRAVAAARKTLPALTLAFVAMGLAVVLPPALARAAPASSLRELFAQLGACLKQPADMPSGEITLRFSLRRDGALVGRPHISFARVSGDDVQRQAALAAVAAALDRCLPAQMTDSLGGAVAGRPLTLRLISHPPDREI